MLYWLLDGVMSIFSALHERPLVGGSYLYYLAVNCLYGVRLALPLL